jgi:DNA-binding IclR family transcriptional regulator
MGVKGSSKAAQYIIKILSSFSEDIEEIGVNETSKKLGIYPSSAQRLFTGLKEGGILEQNPKTRKYRLGLKMFEMGLLFGYHLGIRRIARPHLEQLAARFDVNCHLGMLSGISATIIDRIHNLESSSLIQRLSINVPLHCSGVGKAILAFLPRDKQQEVLNKIRLVRYTQNTIADRGGLKKELDWIARHGYAVDRGELHINIHCVGAPVLDKNSNVVISISASDSRERLTDQKMKDIIPELIKTAESISLQL